MPHATANDGVKLYIEETGSGTPVIFVHEFAGDMRSWEPQLRHFGQRYRAIAYNARGYPPSDVPGDASAYSQGRAADDIAAVLEHLGIEAAHVVGLSMGGFATLHFGFRHPVRARSLTVAGCGYGAEPGKREAFEVFGREVASTLRADQLAVDVEDGGRRIGKQIGDRGMCQSHLRHELPHVFRAATGCRLGGCASTERGCGECCGGSA